MSIAQAFHGANDVGEFYCMYMYTASSRLMMEVINPAAHEARFFHELLLVVVVVVVNVR